MVKVKGKEIAGWTAGLTVLGAGVIGLASMIYTPPSSLRGENDRKFSLFEHVFLSSGIEAQNHQILVESISKKLVETAKAKQDSVVAIQKAHADSISMAKKLEMAKKHIKPKAVFHQNQVRMPQKHALVK